MGEPQVLPSAPKAESKPTVARRPSVRETKIVPTVPKVGRLVVTGNVEGARITIDGRTGPGWVTPYTFSDLPAGSHEVVLSKDGYENLSMKLVVQEGRTTSFAGQLLAPGGQINIVTNPPGLGVSIDGGPFAPSPLQATVGAGTHTYRIKLPGSGVYEGTFEMKIGAVITRKVDLVGTE